MNIKSLSIAGAFVILALITGIFAALGLATQLLIVGFITVLCAIGLSAIALHRFGSANVIGGLILAAVLSSILVPRYIALPIPGLADLTLARLFTFVLLLMLLLVLIGDAKYREVALQKARANWYLLALGFAYIIVAVASVLLAARPTQHLGALLNELLAFWLIFFVTATFGGGQLWPLRTLKYIAYSMLFIVSLACVELLISKYIIPTIVPRLMISQAAALELASFEKYRAGILRVQATSSNPLVLAELLAACMFLILGALSNARGVARISLYVAVVGSFVATYATGSRTAFAILLLMCPVYLAVRFVWKSFAKGAMRVFAMLVLFTVFAVLAILVQQVLLDVALGRSISEAQSTSVRGEMYRGAFAVARDAAPLGLGAGSAIQEIGVRSGSGLGLTVDGYFANVLVDAGFGGFFLYVTFLLAIIVVGLLRFQHAGERQVVVLGIVFSVLSFFVFRGVLSITDNAIIFGFLCGALLIVTYPDQEAVSRTP